MVKEVRPLELGSEYFDADPFLSNLVANGFRPYVVIKEGKQAISNANWEFTYNAAPANLTHNRVANSGSYNDMAIVSGSANDDSSAAAHCQKVKIWGVDKDNYLRVEEIACDGATSASSTNSFFELGDIYASQFGTGGADAAGAIDVAMVGKVTSELLRIAAGKTTCPSARIPIPKTWRAKILSVDVYLQDNDVGLTAGVMVFPQYYDAVDCKDEDSTHVQKGVTRAGAHFGISAWPRVYGNDTTYSLLEFKGNRIKTSETWGLTARVALWATHACSSNRRQIVGDLT